MNTPEQLPRPVQFAQALPPGSAAGAIAFRLEVQKISPEENRRMREAFDPGRDPQGRPLLDANGRLARPGVRGYFLQFLALHHREDLQHAGFSERQIGAMADLRPVALQVGNVAFQVHHEIPLEVSGLLPNANDFKNLVLICADEHNRVLHREHLDSQWRDLPPGQRRAVTIVQPEGGISAETGDAFRAWLRAAMKRVSDLTARPPTQVPHPTTPVPWVGTTPPGAAAGSPGLQPPAPHTEGPEGPTTPRERAPVAVGEGAGNARSPGFGRALGGAGTALATALVLREIAHGNYGTAASSLALQATLPAGERLTGELVGAALGTVARLAGTSEEATAVLGQVAKKVPILGVGLSGYSFLQNSRAAADAEKRADDPALSADMRDYWRQKAAYHLTVAGATAETGVGPLVGGAGALLSEAGRAGHNAFHPMPRDPSKPIGTGLSRERYASLAAATAVFRSDRIITGRVGRAVRSTSLHEEAATVENAPADGQAYATASALRRFFWPDPTGQLQEAQANGRREAQRLAEGSQRAAETVVGAYVPDARVDLPHDPEGGAPPPAVGPGSERPGVVGAAAGGERSGPAGGRHPRTAVWRPCLPGRRQALSQRPARLGRSAARRDRGIGIDRRRERILVR